MMKRRSALAATLLAGASLFLTAPESGNAAAFMKLGDIKGEALDTEHKDLVNILLLHTQDINIGVGELGIGIGELQIGIGEGPTRDDFVAVQRTDDATDDYWKGLLGNGEHHSLILINKDEEGPDLAHLFREAMANNGLLDDLVVIAGISGNSCKIHITGAEIIGYSWQSFNSEGDPIPTEQLSLNYEKVEFEVVELKLRR